MGTEMFAARQPIPSRTPAAGLVWLAGACAFGVAAAAAGALQGVANLIALYVLASSRGAHVELWFETWEGLPLWGVGLAALAAALGAWSAVLDRTRPDPRRAVITVAALALATVGGAWLRGDPGWLAVVAGVTWQWAVAWRLAGRLSRHALEGSGVEQAERGLLATAGFVVGAWALSTLEPVQFPGAGVLEIAAVCGMAIALISGALYLSGLRRVQLASRFQGENVQVDEALRRTPQRTFALWVVAAVILALWVPSDFVPFHIRDFNRWMEAFTDRIGPWLVPSARVNRGGGDLVSGVFGMLYQALSAGSAQTGPANPARRIVQALLLVVLAALVWRILRRRERPLAPSRAAGRIPLGFRWLLEEARRAILRLLARLGWFVTGGRPAAPVAGEEAGDPVRPRRRPGRLPRNVILLYLHVIERLGAWGLARRPSETPLEYLGRWRAQSASPDERGLPVLTRYFLAVRYGGAFQDDAMQRDARKAASAALRGWRREALAARVRSWIRRRRGDDRQGV